MRIIFLDVDGVLNNPVTEDRIYGWRGIDPELVQNLKFVYDESNKEEETRIVVSSSWKNDEIREKTSGYVKNDNCYKVLLERLNNADMEVIGYTPNSKISGWHRDEEILKWLSTYNEDHDPVSNYVILDDETFNFEKHEDLYKRFVRTVESKKDDRGYDFTYVYEVGSGIQKEHMEKALRILRGDFGEEEDVRNS